MTIHWQEIAGSLFIASIVAHALQTIPTPENRWARWLIGVLQFVAANYTKTREAFKAPADQAPTS